MRDKPFETGLIGGIEKRDITIVDYDPNWPKRFEQHANVISNALGAAALQIEHIGSTAVPDLRSKPIIDILVVVSNSADESAYLPQLEASGYILRVREPDWHEHRMFRTLERDVHIHIYSAGCPEIERTVRFRDRLRQNAGDRNLYENVKRQLAAQNWPDMNAYANAKTEVVEEILRRAV
ncbi:MAG TPA: GrpB family protein [Candidatus Acidoferrales bacterium]|nr:GrpB family protein [Candidatus Acidoferrales bacterium]